MSQAGYLFRLNAELGKRLGRIKKLGVGGDGYGLSRHAAYLASKQLDSGGFPDREGEPDLYYTAFGLRGLALLGELTAAGALRAAGISSVAAVPSGVGSPCVAMLSLMVTGTPSSGPSGRLRCQRAALARA